MPTFSKPASGFWSKFRFQEPLGAFDYVKASQARFKPASKYNPVQSSAMRTTMIGSPGKSDDVEVSGGPSDQGFELQEDPSLWKDHNIHMSTFSKPASSFWSRIHFQERLDPSFDYEHSIPPCCKKIRSHGKSDEVEVSVEPSDFELQEYPLEIEAKVAAKEEWANIKDVKEDYDPNWHSDSGATRHMAIDALSFIIPMFIMVWIG